MKEEQQRTSQALATAIRIEIEGKAYYLKAAEQTQDPLGKELLQSLAAEEDVHRQKFEQIYAAISNARGWPEVDFRPDGGQGLRRIFGRVTQQTSSKTRTPKTQFDLIRGAIDKEEKSRSFYQEQSKAATNDPEHKFYETLASEERGHYLVLTNYFEYLSDPASWFVKAEHHSLDGG